MIEQRIRQLFVESATVLASTAERSAASIVKAVEALEAALRRGGKVLAFGNGGSAADS